ncbi:DUF262 domain-containing protein [Pseudomonas fluorescens]|nr:DUF262 domain-containing protein [Pseudomonas fluorescens]NKI53516.1 DUF262 domain-containing protein [Pseudomonas fluorescens]NKI62292.1 DUF262 domain-containing protein [Pseudomonas fluorescens]
MNVTPRDEKIKSVFDDIIADNIDLRPDFQRGEVWDSNKKKLLIDSIFRGWQVPPIHLVRIDGHKAEVLDGQQRLTAIRDFMQNKFAIDGAIEPLDDDIVELGGLKYSSLPEDKKIEFQRYLLKIYEITHYNHGEPGELFHRLNQSVKLTSAEQRNAFFGSIRDQVSSLVSYMAKKGIDKTVLGFSNSRMAYNDLLTRVCFILENSGLRTPISDRSLTARFRNKDGFSQEIINAVKGAIDFLVQVKENLISSEDDINLTKASSFNWLYVLASELIDGGDLGDERFFKGFIYLELAKNKVKNNLQIDKDLAEYFGFDRGALRELLLLYIERSSSRVTSTSSILIRDLVINISLALSGYSNRSLYTAEDEVVASIIESIRNSSDDIKTLIEDTAVKWRSE